MKKNWIVTLCALLIFSVLFGLSVPLRIAIGANAILIFVNIVKRVRGAHNGRTEEKN